MAQRITRLVFWAGGVVLPTLPEATASFLTPGRPATLPERLGWQAAAAALSGVPEDPGQYCARVAGALGAPDTIPATLLHERLATGIAALPGMPDLIVELARTLEVRLVSDYPSIWLLPALGRSGLANCFPAAGISYVAGLGEIQGILDTLVGASVILPGHTIWVDAHSPRTSAALRHGVDAAIFVDARRLRRDLSLWRLVPLPE